MTVETMAEVIDLIMGKCEKYNMKNKTEIVRKVGENLIAISEVCTFDQYKRKQVKTEMMIIHNLDKYRIEAYHIKNDKYKAEFYYKDELMFEENYWRKHNMENSLGEMGIKEINYHSSNGEVIRKEVKETEGTYHNYYKFYKKKVGKNG